jgi:glutamate/tyrosine decarboxylase-like PLP-dependent enzyme
MKELVKKIKNLEKISKELEPSEKNRSNYQQQVNNLTNQFINSICDTPAYKQGNVSSTDFKITEQQKSLEEILTIYDKEVIKKGINPASGGHIGYIPGGGIYTSALSDFLAAITNEYAGMFYASPGAVTMENELINWMKSIFNFPKTAIGNLTSGGSIANLIAVTSARDKFKIKNEKITKSVIYLSPQTHHCIHKALRITGLEDVNIRNLELDDNSKIDSKKLSAQITEDKNQGLIPFMVIASAGTTDTGAVDPLLDIGHIAKEHKIWYHIDAAYGGFFILTETKKHLFRGIEMADSIVIDPHKGLFLPYGLGAVLIKDKEAAFHSHHYTANYMQDAVDENLPLNPADVSPELTKHFRGLRMWLPLQLHGLKPFVACLDEKILLTTYFRKKLKELGFKLGPEPDLSVSYFWYPSDNIDVNAFNKKLMQFIHEDGTVFLSSSTINGRFVIRMAILSFRTKKETIDLAIGMIKNAILKTNLHFKI